MPGAEPSATAIEQVIAWVNAENAVSAESTGAIRVQGDPPIEIQAASDRDRISLSYYYTEDGVGSDRVAAAYTALPDTYSRIQGSIKADHGSLKATLTASVDTAELTREGFVTLLTEIITAADRLLGQRQVDAPSPQEPPPAAAPPPATQAVWDPTHIVTAGGIRAWPTSDPAVGASRLVEEGTRLVLERRSGLWAKVKRSDGWSGWVEAAHQLTPIAGRRTPPKATEATFALMSNAGLIGAIAVGVGAFLPWIREGYAVKDVASFELPFGILFDPLGASGAPYLGYFMIGFALATLVASLSPAGAAWRRIFGLAVLVICIVYAVQLNTFAHEVSFLGGSLTVWGIIGVGPGLSAAGGTLALLFPQPRARG